MKIIVENKKEVSTSIVLNLSKALAVKSEDLQGGGKLLTVDYVMQTYAYSDNDCNFYLAEVAANGAVHAPETTIPDIVAAYIGDGA